MISPDLTVAALPLDIVEANPAQNIANIRKYLPLLPDSTDIIVLPELFSTGYIDNPTEAARFAETDHDDTMRSIAAIAEAYNVAICGSFLARTGSNLYNRAFFIEPDGETAFYDKRHLFCISDEAGIAQKGCSLPPLVRFRGMNITFAICYDVRFPAWIRASALHSDMMIIPANWPEKRAFAWQHLLQARAIENQIYIVGCNRSGKTAFGKFDNLSYIIDYTGKIIGSGYADSDSADSENNLLGDAPIVAVCSKTDLRHFRQHFPVWSDADQFDIDFDSTKPLSSET